MTQTPAYTPLRRSRTDRVLAGICAGFARYLGVDPVAVRVVTVLLAFVTGGGLILAYLVAWLIMPEDDAAPAWYPAPPAPPTAPPAA